MGSHNLPVLLVDDETQLLHSASIALRSSGISNVKTISDSRTVLPLLGEEEVGLLVIDLSMPHITGRELLKQVSENFPDIPTILMTATNDLGTAVECMQMGAIDYLVKPVDKDRLVAAVKRGLEFRSLRTEIMSLKDSMLREGPKRGDVFAGMLTQSKSMLTIFRYLEAIGPSSQPVLVTGESGTGKELVAQALHKLSGRSGELVSVDVAGLDDTMFSDTLFGHSRGAFSGAERPREGLVATAGDGTLFLDEIGDLSMASQVKLLRLLQDGTYRALGADEYRRSRARIIAATNRDVLTDVEAGRFRRDLYFRLKTHHLHLPPLRSRMSDLPMLLGHFIAKEAAEHGKAAPEIPTSLIQLLRTYGWPGNVRELKGMCIDAMARHEGTMLSLRSFRDSMAGKPMTAEPEDKLEKIASWLPDELPTLRDAEEALIAEAMRRVNGNQTLAAGILGLSRQALNKRLTRKKDTDEADDADQE